MSIARASGAPVRTLPAFAARDRFRPLIVMETDPVLFLFAKEPRPGEVKTRLAAGDSGTAAIAVDLEAAAECQRAFTKDLLRRVCSGAQQAGYAAVLAASPAGHAPWLGALAADHEIPLRWQGGGDLGLRMRRAMEDGCRTHGVAVIIGSDVPDLPLERVEEALRLLAVPDACDVVLGPCPDGGYYLIAARDRCPPVFELNCEWGGDAVLEETCRRLLDAGLRFELLQPWEDVDEPGALLRLAARLQASHELRDDLEETTRVLERLGLLERLTPRGRA
jgi:rSAM/selenodomain-associated transferase 1